jgi:hypothetical protein
MLAGLTSIAVLIAPGVRGALLSNVTLAWNPSPGSFIAGYRLYLGPTSQTYTTLFDAGNVTTATASNLLAGTTYFFAVTAYDLAGLESPFSTEIGYTIPVPLGSLAKLSASMTGSKQMTLSGTAPIGYQYSVLASSDLLHWTSIGSVTANLLGAFQFTDGGSTANSARYYRFRQTFP